MKKQSFPTTLYWKEIPDDSLQINDVLLHGQYQEPAKIMNSTEVTAHTKPWLVKRRGKTSEKYSLIKEQSKLKQVSQPKVQNSLVQKFPSATLKDLRQEDKKKVTHLILELAKSDSEKEDAVKTLDKVKKDYETKINKLQIEKEQIIKKHDCLKEKHLEYELYIERTLAQQSHTTSNTNNMVTHHKVINGNNEAAQNVFTNHDTKPEPVIDNFSELFIEQQGKFYRQQEVLQQQIEHLQKLQESIMKQQNKDIYRLSDRSIDMHRSSSENTYILPKERNKNIGRNTRKLESYILSETSIACIDDSSRENFNSSSSKSRDVKNSHEIQIENPAQRNFISPLSQCKYDENMKRKLAKEMCVQTEDSHNTDNEADGRLMNCEKDICKLQESLVQLSQSFSGTNSADPSTNHFNSNKHMDNERHQIADSSRRMTEVAESTRRTTQIIGSPQTSTNVSSSKIKTLSNTTTPSCCCPLEKDNTSNDTDELDHVITHDQTMPPSSSSAVKRRHFQPSSILDLVSGMQPQSASTSVDQYTMRKKQQQQPSATSIHGTTIQKVGGVKRSVLSSHRKMPTRTDEDEIEERNMLEDIFFLK